MDSKQSEPFDIEDEEVFFEHSSNSPEDDEFDSIVSCLEEILQDDSFQSMLTKFYQDNCENFEEGKENKLEYTTTYNSYTTMVENALETFLSQKIPGFSMKRFESLVGSRKDELSGEVFDLLLSLGDFMEFKDTMVSHRNAKMSSSKSGGGMLDLSVSGHHV